MASERIPACASYLTANAAPHIARVIQRIPHGPRWEWDRLVDEAFKRARDTLSPERIRAILGPIRDYTREAYASAIGLSNDAIAIAAQDREVGDGRRNAETRQQLLIGFANDHIRRRMWSRGMDPDEVARLLAEGESE